MTKKYFIIFCFIFICLLSMQLALKCQENEIENCIECKTGDNSDKCSLCEVKYFLALDGEVCIKCDDSYYGMVGCAGSCTFMKELSNVKCQEDSCKTGYYEIVPGYCSICSLIDENCLECDYLKTNSEFKCKKCKEHYFPNNDGLCELCEEEDCLKCSDKNFCIECKEGKTAYPDGKCYLNIENCKIGVYSTEKNSSICIECNRDYYPDFDGICQKCETELFLTRCHKCHLDGGKIKCDEGSILTGCTYFSKLSSCESCSVKDDELRCDKCKEYSDYYSQLYITQNGECRNCKQDSERGYCLVCSDDPKAPCDLCYERSVLIDDKCIRCDTLFDKCDKCSKSQCLKCYSGYGFLYEEGCTSCKELFGEGCLSCGLNPYDGKPYCAECQYGYFYGTDGKCKTCQEDGNLSNCKKCRELGKNGYICTQCENYYELLDGKCYKTCSIYQVLGNDGECRSCSSNEVGLSNCNQCQKISDGQFECTNCYYGYKLINGKCIQIEEDEINICNEIENISTEESPIYSCVNCPNNEYVQIMKENGAKICIKKSQYQELNACELGSIISEEEKKYICNKCINNSELVYDEDLNKNKCICKEGYFFDASQEECRKCDELNPGCLKCDATLTNVGYYFNCYQCDKFYAKDGGHCFYCYGNCEECNIKEDGSQECLKYKEPYFLSNTSEVKKCFDYLQNCVSCSYKNEEKTELHCDKCIENYFKNKNEECVECNEINNGCLVCSDDEERLKNFKCDQCKNNYFMTKENTCEFCLSEKKGGNNCKECGYINIENEGEKIGCIKCVESNYILLNGKCYSPIDNCKDYESYLDNNNEVKIRCKECNDKFELNKYYRCIKIKNFLPNCLKTNENIDNLECLECESGFDLIDNNCIEKTVSEDDKIEGCLNYETKYGYNYCISCNNNYYLRNGNCIEKYKSIYSNDCKSSYFENGIFECNSCKEYSVKVLDHLLCNIQAIFNCNKLTNLGNELRPIYSCDNDKYNDRIILEDENGIKTYSKDIYDERCLEGKKSTLYYNDTYTCTKCKNPYILSYSDFYEKKICKDIYEEEKKNEFGIEYYESDQGVPIINGKCEDGYFTRNEKICIKCDDENIGMEGCGGKCDFKINREYQLKCEYNKCKEGYFEIIPGQCEKCEKKLKGCNKCQYFENDEKKYIVLEPIRKRQLLCIDECQGKDVFKYDNKCLECKDIITNCEECINDNNEIKCKKAKDGYFINNNGIVIQCPSNCDKCTLVNENNKLNIKCLMTSNSNYFINKNGQVKECDDYYEGIANCTSCSYNNNKLICTFCQSGYIA